MTNLSSTAAAAMAALALAGGLAAPARAQEVRRPVPHRAAEPARPAIQAQQPRRHGNGAGVAAGVIGGLAAGAILGGILSNGAAARPAPVEEVEGPGTGCPLVRQPVYDGAGRFAGYQAVPSC